MPAAMLSSVLFPEPLCRAGRLGGHVDDIAFDVEFPADCRVSAKSDSIKDAVDYDTVARTVGEVCAGGEFHLIETVAEQIAARILEKFPISQVRILVRKVSPIASHHA
jgi:dihydroneopterin aldolase